MIEHISIEHLYTGYEVGDLIPQAVIDSPLSYFTENLRMHFSDEVDGLDSYKGIGLVIDNKLPVALKVYPGYPDDTVAMCFPAWLDNIEEISQNIRIVLSNLDLPPISIRWERRMGPDL